MEDRICKACGETKAISEYYFRNDRNDYSNRCKKCHIHNIKIPKSNTYKVCKHCGISKEFSEYQLAGGGKWLQPYCKSCDANRKRIWTETNTERLSMQRKLYYQQNKEAVIRRCKEYVQNNKELVSERRRKYAEKNSEVIKMRGRDYFKRNRNVLKERNRKRYYDNHEENLRKQKLARQNRTPEQIAAKREYDRLYKVIAKEKVKKYREKNREKIREAKRIWSNKKAATDIQYRLKRNIRTRIRCALKPNNAYKADTSEKLLGCSIQFYKEYFQSLFAEGMSWEKFLLGEIEIDHIKPCKLFDLTLESEQRKCFHYTNTQPLWVADNLAKGSKYEQAA